MQTRPNYDITPIQRRILWRIREHPESYLRRRSISELATWMYGYDAGIRFSGADTEEHNILPDGLNQYAIEKILFKKTSPMRWDMILLQKNEGNEEHALLDAWQLLDSYLQYRGFLPINRESCRTLMEQLLEKKHHRDDELFLFLDREDHSPRDLTARERNFLALLLKRPGMYTGTNKFIDFAAFERGFRIAMLAAHHVNDFCLMPPALHQYICSTLRKGMDGCDAILSHEKDEKKQWELFRTLLDKYLAKHGFAPLAEYEPLDMEALAKTVDTCHNIGDAERRILGIMKKYPAAYLGTVSGNAFFHFCNGYTFAKPDSPILPEGFAETAEKLYEYSFTGETPLPTVLDYLDVYLRVHGYDEIEASDPPKSEVNTYDGEICAAPPALTQEQRTLLCRICNNPAAYFGKADKPLAALEVFANGWHTADPAHPLIPSGMHAFTAKRLLGHDRTVKGWCLLLQEHEDRTGMDAFRTFFELFLDEYLMKHDEKPIAYKNIAEFPLKFYDGRNMNLNCVHDAMTESFVRTFNAAPWHDHWTEQTASKRLQDLKNMPNFEGMTAYAGDRLCGAILGRGEQYDDGMYFQIIEFWTIPTMQGSGLGSRLLAEFMAHLKDKGYRKVFLLTMKGERTEGFYQKQGFSTAEGMCLMESFID